MFMRNVNIFLAVLTAASLTGCGGGGDGATGVSTNTTYQSVATAGELISYSVDRTNLTYAYTITESAYGKTGTTGSGTLTLNADGTYTPSGFTNGRIKILDNGLLVGAIYEDLDDDSVKEIIPVMGISNPIKSAADAAGIYNFVSRQCVTSGCFSTYGTLKVKGDGSWQICEEGNLASTPTTPACSTTTSGTVSAFTSGKGDVLVGGVKAGSMLIFKDSSDQKVILVDLNGAVPTLGKGAFFASSQGFASSTDGTWHYSTTAGSRGTVFVTGNTIVDRGVNSLGNSYGPFSFSFQFDQPWTGFGRTTTSDTIGILAGAGMFAAFNGRGNQLSIGIR
jgi:hypothetical protein